ncbi:MAG: hypothetical protein QQW96_23490 [Tychonema bourrellyi B0820]|nr:hypothetical protein [Tychonema bourrellyi]MDQ2100596.1 hypothetical protein [Tychonema bourrellyi B0820]
MIPKQSTYRDRLQPWHLIRHLPNCQRLTVAQETGKMPVPQIFN